MPVRPRSLTPEGMRASLLAELERAEQNGLPNVELLREVLVPFAVRMVDHQLRGDVWAMADMTVTAAAALVGHLFLSAAPRSLTVDAAVDALFEEVRARTLRSLGAEMGATVGGVQ